MRIAVGQAASRGDVEANVEAAVDLLAQARADDADLLLLGELFLPGYDVEAIGANRDLSVTLDDPRLSPLADACLRHGVAVAVGAAVHRRDGSRPENAVLWVTPDGAVHHPYSKIHLWRDEYDVFDAGARPALVEAAHLRLGLGVCYDAGFPELTRWYARHGAHAVLFSSAFTSDEGQRHRYDVYHPARALENGVYVAVADSTGGLGTQEFLGHSRLFDPRGRCVVDAGTHDGVSAADISPEAVTSARADVPYLDDMTDEYPTPTTMRMPR